MSETERFGCATSGDDLLAIGEALRAAVGEHLVERARTRDGLSLRIARHAAVLPDLLHQLAEPAAAAS